MLRSLFFALLGALMLAAWAHWSTAAAYLATALLVVMVASTIKPSTRQQPPHDRI